MRTHSIELHGKIANFKGLEKIPAKVLKLK